MSNSVAQLEALVKAAATEAGFDLAGIAPARFGDSRELRFFSDWIAAGRAGEMAYLESRDHQGRLKRAALEHVAPWARSVIVCALNYNTAHPRSTECHDPERGWISRYAWGDADYHEVVMERLRRVEARLREEAADPALQTRCYVDTGPVVERVFAAYAGVGWIGKNTCLINQRVGSWLFLGVILISLELAPDLPAADRCGSCTRCLDACPTQAFVAPHELDATRCISYLTSRSAARSRKSCARAWETTSSAATSARTSAPGTARLPLPLHRKSLRNRSASTLRWRGWRTSPTRTFATLSAVRRSGAPSVPACGGTRW